MAGDTLRVRVTAVRPEAQGIVGLSLASLDGSRLPPFEAGAHVDLHLAGGLCRQYSLIGDPSGSHYELAVKREPQSKGGSVRMHGLKPGDEVIVGRPRNNFPVIAQASHHVLFAGGIGITPLLCMARAFVGRGTSFHLHYFASAEAQVAFRGELMSSAMADRVTLHVGLGPDDVARVAAEVLARPLPDAHLYICGPAPFMDSVSSVARRTLPETSIHLEHFTREAVGEGNAFEVVLARRGVTLAVPRNLSILDVLVQNGVDVDYACQKGICGTCVVRLLGGKARHLDTFLTPTEQAEGCSLAICVSRADGDRLVLDL